MRLQQMTTACRTAVLITAALVTGTLSAQSEIGSKTVVFVCQHGSAKSVVAAEHFNRIAEQNHLPYRAVARGVKPDDAIPQFIRAGLLADGLNPTAKPQAITQDIQRAARVVTLETELPEPAPDAKLVKWTGIPSLSDNYSSGRSAIVVHVQELITNLSAAPKR